MGMNAGMFFGGVTADPCDNAPTINSVTESQVFNNCPSLHQTKATLSISGTLQGSQLYEYETKLDGGSFTFHSRTSSITATKNNTAGCGGPGLFGCSSQEWSWRCRVVESESPFSACTSFVTSGVHTISGEAC